MRKLLILYLILVFPLPCYSAWTDKYVTVAGAGVHDGSLGNEWTLAEAIAGVAAGNRVNIIAGIYANAATNRAFATAGTTTTPIWWRGYNTTPGDLDTLASHATLALPLITFTTGQMTSAGTQQIFSNLSITSQCLVGGGAWNTTGGKVTILRCRVVNTSANAASTAVTWTTNSGNFIIGSYLQATPSANVLRDATGLNNLIDSYLVGGLNGLSAAGQVYIDGCLITGAAADGVTGASVLNIYNSTIASNTDDGISFTAAIGTNVSTISHVILSNNGGYGVNNASGANTNQIRIWYPVFYSNTLGNMNAITEDGDYNSDLGLSLLSQLETASPFKLLGTNYELQYNSLAMGSNQTWVYENSTMKSYQSAGGLKPPVDGWKVITENSRFKHDTFFAIVGLLVVAVPIIILVVLERPGHAD